MTQLCAKSHCFATLFAVVTFKAYALFLVCSHMRILILLVLFLVWAGVTPVPAFLMAEKVPVKVALILESMVASFVFAHVI